MVVGSGRIYPLPIHDLNIKREYVCVVSAGESATHSFCGLNPKVSIRELYNAIITISDECSGMIYCF